jgi:hypothetical protein
MEDIHMRPHIRPRRVTHVLSQRVAEKLVLLDARSGAYYSLDDVGARVWELCDGTRSVADTISAICDEYAADVTTIEADVLDLLADLSRERLIEAPTEATTA